MLHDLRVIPIVEDGIGEPAELELLQGVGGLDVTRILQVNVIKPFPFVTTKIRVFEPSLMFVSERETKHLTLYPEAYP